MKYHINIGSNQGDSIGIINDAVALIALISKSTPRLSDFYHSKPWGFESDNDFINLGVEIETELSPKELLAELQNIERRLCATPHRNQTGGYIDRNLDIDLICVVDSDYFCASEELTLPHPIMEQRMFVLEPLRRLSPDWIHPVTKKTLNLIIKELENE